MHNHDATLIKLYISNPNLSVITCSEFFFLFLGCVCILPPLQHITVRYEIKAASSQVVHEKWRLFFIPAAVMQPSYWHNAQVR